MTHWIYLAIGIVIGANLGILILGLFMSNKIDQL